MKILIVLPGGIGNAVMFTPAFASLVKSFPESEFYMLTSGLGANRIFEPSNKIKRFFFYDSFSKSSFLKTLFNILIFHKFDVFISSMGINPLKSGILALFSKAGVRCGESSCLFNKRTEPDLKKHEVERNLKIIEEICPADSIVKSLQFYYKKDDAIQSEKILKETGLNSEKIRLIGAHIGSNDFLAAKRWNIENFKKLFSEIEKINPDVKILLLGGSNEFEYAKSVSGKNTINLTGKTNLQTAGLIIKKCAAFISNDNGLMHIAASVKTPVIAIFGPTIISKNRPYSENSEIISENLDCQPCYKYNKKIICPNNFKCMNDITVEKVLPSVAKYLSPVF
ncbi:MAG TPA: glycosyltransferase family 9 protein [bacterium]|nr:glycosyltransferase family 9 protein [bacterium]